VETPLSEEREGYRVTIWGSFGQRVAEVAAPAFTYSAAMQAADGAAGPVTVEVAQLGTHGASRSARLIVDIGGE
jgi:hypothetical protein